MAPTKLDKGKLLELLKEKKSASEIRKTLAVSAASLQKKMGEMLFHNRKLYIPKDLYPSKSGAKVSKSQRLTINLNNFPDSNFKEGDEFKISATAKRITLIKV